MFAIFSLVSLLADPRCIGFVTLTLLFSKNFIESIIPLCGRFSFSNIESLFSNILRLVLHVTDTSGIIPEESLFVGISRLSLKASPLSVGEISFFTLNASNGSNVSFTERVLSGSDKSLGNFSSS
uniref:Secreted protein n=1 Tax=Cacopsylla melanoneura TaxID=428564 RepID=A0A8D8XCI6_9HEMI